MLSLPMALYDKLAAPRSNAGGGSPHPHDRSEGAAALRLSQSAIAEAEPRLRVLQVFVLLAMFGRGQLFQRITFLLDLFRIAEEVEDDPGCFLVHRAAAIAEDLRARARKGFKGPSPMPMSPRSQADLNARLEAEAEAVSLGGAMGASGLLRAPSAVSMLDRSMSIDTLGRLVTSITQVCVAVGAASEDALSSSLEESTAQLVEAGRVYTSALAKDHRVLQLMTGESVPIDGVANAHSRPAQGAFASRGDSRGGSRGSGRVARAPIARPSAVAVIAAAGGGAPRPPRRPGPPSPNRRHSTGGSSPPRHSGLAEQKSSGAISEDSSEESDGGSMSPAGRVRLLGGQYRRSANLGTQLISVPLQGFSQYEPSLEAMAAIKSVPAALAAKRVFAQATSRPQLHPGGRLMSVALAYTSALPPQLWMPRPPPDSPLALRNPVEATARKGHKGGILALNTPHEAAGKPPKTAGGNASQLELVERLTMAMGYALGVEEAQHKLITQLDAEGHRRMAEWRRKVGRGGAGPPRRHRMSIMESISASNRAGAGKRFDLQDSTVQQRDAALAPPTLAKGSTQPDPSRGVRFTQGASPSSPSNAVASPVRSPRAFSPPQGMATPHGQPAGGSRGAGLMLTQAPTPLVPRDRVLSSTAWAHRLDKWAQARVHVDTVRTWCLTHPIPRALWGAVGWPIKTPGKYERAYTDATGHIAWETHSLLDGVGGAGGGDDGASEAESLARQRAQRTETSRALKALILQTHLNVGDVKRMQSDFAAISQDGMTVTKAQFAQLMMRTLARLARSKGIGADRAAVALARDDALAAAASNGRAEAIAAAAGTDVAAVRGLSGGAGSAAARADSKAAKVSLTHFLQRGSEMSSRRVMSSAARAAASGDEHPHTGGSERGAGGVVTVEHMDAARETARMQALREKWFGGVMDLFTIKRVQRRRLWGDAPPSGQTNPPSGDAARTTAAQASSTGVRFTGGPTPRSRHGAGSDDDEDELPASFQAAALGVETGSSHPGLWRLTERLFSAFDASGDGEVDFMEFALGVSRMCEGDVDAKLGLVFDMLDVDGSGEVSPLELILMVLGGRTAIRQSRRQRRHSPVSLLSLMGSATSGARRIGTGVRDEKYEQRERLKQQMLSSSGGDDGTGGGSSSGTGGGADGDRRGALDTGIDMALIVFAQQLATAMDLNGDGRISRDEFFEVVSAEPILYECFSDALDMTVDGSGPVFSFELLHVMQQHYSYDPHDPTTMPAHIQRKYLARRGSSRMGTRSPRKGAGGSTRVDDDTGQLRLRLLDREVDIRAFRRLMVEQFGAPKHSQHLMASMFSVMDADHGGTVDLRELFMALQLACRGSTLQRANFFFDVFDRRGRGELQLDEVYDMILATAPIKKGQGGLEEYEHLEDAALGDEAPVTSPTRDASLDSTDGTAAATRAERRAALDLKAEARRRMDELDENGDGCVDRDEFVSAVLRDEAQLHFFMRILGLGAGAPPPTEGGCVQRDPSDSAGLPPAAVRGGIVEKRRRDSAASAAKAAAAASGGKGSDPSALPPLPPTLDTSMQRTGEEDSLAGDSPMRSDGASPHNLAALMSPAAQALAAEVAASRSNRAMADVVAAARSQTGDLMTGSASPQHRSGSTFGGTSSGGTRPISRGRRRLNSISTPSAQSVGGSGTVVGSALGFAVSSRDAQSVKTSATGGGSASGKGGSRARYLGNALNKAFASAKTDERTLAAELSADGSSDAAASPGSSRGKVALRHLAQLTNFGRIANMVGAEQRAAEDRAAEAKRQQQAMDKKVALRRRAAGPGGYYKQSPATAAALMRGRRALTTLRSRKRRILVEKRAALKAETLSTAQAEAAASVLSSMDVSLRKQATSEATRAALARTMALAARARRTGRMQGEGSNSDSDGSELDEATMWREGAIATLNLSPRGGTHQTYGGVHKSSKGKDVKFEAHASAAKAPKGAKGGSLSARPAFTTTGGTGALEAGREEMTLLKRTIGHKKHKGGILVDKALISSAMGAHGMPAGAVASASSASMMRLHLHAAVDGAGRDVFGLGSAMRRPGGIGAEAHESNSRRVYMGSHKGVEGGSHSTRGPNASAGTGTAMLESLHDLIPRGTRNTAARALADPLLHRNSESVNNGGALQQMLTGSSVGSSVSSAQRLKLSSRKASREAAAQGAPVSLASARSASASRLGPSATSARGLKAAVSRHDDVKQLYLSLSSSTGHVGLTHVSSETRRGKLYSQDGHAILQEEGDVGGGRRYQAFLRDSAARQAEVAARQAADSAAAAEAAQVHSALYIHQEVRIAAAATAQSDQPDIRGDGHEGHAHDQAVPVDLVKGIAKDRRRVHQRDIQEAERQEAVVAFQGVKGGRRASPRAGIKAAAKAHAPPPRAPVVPPLDMSRIISKVEEPSQRSDATGVVAALSSLVKPSISARSLESRGGNTGGSPRYSPRAQTHVPPPASVLASAGTSSSLHGAFSPVKGGSGDALELTAPSTSSRRPPPRRKGSKKHTLSRSRSARSHPPTSSVSADGPMGERMGAAASHLILGGGASSSNTAGSRGVTLTSDPREAAGQSEEGSLLSAQQQASGASLHTAMQELSRLISEDQGAPIAASAHPMMQPELPGGKRSGAFTAGAGGANRRKRRAPGRFSSRGRAGTLAGALIDSASLSAAGSVALLSGDAALSQASARNSSVSASSMRRQAVAKGTAAGKGSQGGFHSSSSLGATAPAGRLGAAGGLGSASARAAAQSILSASASMSGMHTLHATSARHGPSSSSSQVSAIRARGAPSSRGMLVSLLGASNASIAVRGGLEEKAAPPALLPTGFLGETGLSASGKPGSSSRHQLQAQHGREASVGGSKGGVGQWGRPPTREVSSTGGGWQPVLAGGGGFDVNPQSADWLVAGPHRAMLGDPTTTTSRGGLPKPLNAKAALAEADRLIAGMEAGGV